MKQTIDKYYIYSLQGDPENIFKDEFEDFFIQYKSLKYISEYKDFFIENFPDIKNQVSQIKEFKKSNKRIECTKSDDYLILAAYKGDELIRKLMLPSYILTRE